MKLHTLPIKDKDQNDDKDHDEDNDHEEDKDLDKDNYHNVLSTDDIDKDNPESIMIDEQGRKWRELLHNVSIWEADDNFKNLKQKIIEYLI